MDVDVVRTKGPEVVLPESLSNPAADDDSCLCPKCGTRLRRLARRGLFQRAVCPLFGFYPWECFTCREKRMMRTRGTHSFHRIWDEFWDEPQDAELAAAESASQTEPDAEFGLAELHSREAGFGGPSCAEDSSQGTECSQAAPQDVA